MQCMYDITLWHDVLGWWNKLNQLSWMYVSRGMYNQNNSVSVYFELFNLAKYKITFKWNKNWKE